VWGSSNGGLLAAAVVTQRPDLFGAAVPQVPLLDMLRCRKDPMTIGAVIADYGNPDVPEDAAVLHAYSPYHRIVDGTAYPAVLFDAGDADAMCPPWHSRKTAHRLAEASSSGRRVRFRLRRGSGHNQMSADEWKQRDGEELTFFADELSLSAPAKRRHFPRLEVANVRKGHRTPPDVPQWTQETQQSARWCDRTGVA
jgi:prolyl oligopeptidase